MKRRWLLDSGIASDFFNQREPVCSRVLEAVQRGDVVGNELIVGRRMSRATASESSEKQCECEPTVHRHCLAQSCQAVARPTLPINQAGPPRLTVNVRRLTISDFASPKEVEQRGDAVSTHMPREIGGHHDGKQNLDTPYPIQSFSMRTTGKDQHGPDSEHWKRQGKRGKCRIVNGKSPLADVIENDRHHFDD